MLNNHDMQYFSCHALSSLSWVLSRSVLSVASIEIRHRHRWLLPFGQNGPEGTEWVHANRVRAAAAAAAGSCASPTVAAEKE